MQIRAEHLALGEAALARGGAHRVGRLEREQRLVAMHDIEGREGFPEVRLELFGAQLH